MRDGRAKVAVLGKPDFCTSVGPLCSGSAPRGNSRHRDGGSTCAGCAAPCREWGRSGVSGGCLSHGDPPERCPWRALVTALIGALEVSMGPCPCVRNVLVEWLLAGQGTNRRGVAPHSLGGWCRNEGSSCCVGVQVEHGSTEVSSALGQSSSPHGHLLESGQQGHLLFRGREAKGSPVPPHNASSSSAGFRHHPPDASDTLDQWAPGAAGPLPSVPEGNDDDGHLAASPSLARRTVQRQSGLGPGDMLCEGCRTIKGTSSVDTGNVSTQSLAGLEEIVPPAGTGVRAGGCEDDGRCKSPHGHLLESGQQADGTTCRTRTLEAAPAPDGVRDTRDLAYSCGDSVRESIRVGPGVTGRVLRSDRDDVEEEVGQVQTHPGEQHYPEGWWVVERRHPVRRRGDIPSGGEAT